MKFEFLGRDGLWLFAAIKKEYFQKLTQFHFIKHLRLTEPKKKENKKKKRSRLLAVTTKFLILISMIFTDIHY